jgi:hypothetical protein
VRHGRGFELGRNARTYSKALKPAMRVTVANHATLGILLTTFNAGGDYITLGTDTGDTATKIYLHAKPTFQDEGMLTFEL